MRAIQADRHGGTEVLAVADLPVPVCGQDQILVKVAAAGVNFIDTYQRSGLYPMALPLTLGREGSGEVIEIGSDVSNIKVGDLVSWPGVQGSYCEFIAMKPTDCVFVPKGVDLQVACAAMLQGMTAHYLVTSVYPIKPGDTALVHAAAGGVGLLLCQMIKSRGGRVIGTVSTEAKVKAALAAGADEVIRYDQEDFVPKVRELTGGLGVNVVYDGVGKSTFDGSLASLARRGLLATFGNASGPVPPLEVLRLSSSGSISLIRPTLVDYIATHEEMQWRADEIFAAIASGALHCAIGESYPLDQAAKAQDDLEARLTSGKLVLVP